MIKSDLKKRLTEANIGIISIDTHILDESTWLYSWQQYIEPTEILPNLVIKPAWQEYNNVDNKTIIEYIDSVIGEKEKAGSTNYSKFKYLPSNGLKGFFYYKCTEAEKKGISVSVNISKQIENSFLKDIETKDFKDLARIIGVYLDNAIEARSTSEDKKLGIEMYLIKENISDFSTIKFYQRHMVQI